MLDAALDGPFAELRRLKAMRAAFAEVIQADVDGRAISRDPLFSALTASGADPRGVDAVMAFLDPALQAANGAPNWLRSQARRWASENLTTPDIHERLLQRRWGFQLRRATRWFQPGLDASSLILDTGPTIARTMVDDSLTPIEPLHIGELYMTVYLHARHPAASDVLTSNVTLDAELFARPNTPAARFAAAVEADRSTAAATASGFASDVHDAIEMALRTDPVAQAVLARTLFLFAAGEPFQRDLAGFVSRTRPLRLDASLAGQLPTLIDHLARHTVGGRHGECDREIAARACLAPRFSGIDFAPRLVVHDQTLAKGLHNLGDPAASESARRHGYPRFNDPNGFLTFVLGHPLRVMVAPKGPKRHASREGENIIELLINESNLVTETEHGLRDWHGRVQLWPWR